MGYVCMVFPRKAGKILIKLSWKIGADIPDTALGGSHRVGPKQRGQARPIIAKFVGHNFKTRLLKNKNKLRGSTPQIFINEDLTSSWDQQKEREKQQAVGVGGMPQGLGPRGIPGQPMQQDPLKSLQTLTMQGTSGLGPGQPQQQPGMMTQQQQQQLLLRQQQLQQQRHQQQLAQMQASNRPPLQVNTCVLRQQHMPATKTSTTTGTDAGKQQASVMGEYMCTYTTTYASNKDINNIWHRCWQATGLPDRQDAFMVTSTQHVQSTAQPLPASSTSQIGYNQPGMPAPGMQPTPGMQQAPGMQAAPGMQPAPGMQQAPGMQAAPGMQPAPGMQQRQGMATGQMVNMMPTQASQFGPQGMAGPSQGQMDGQALQQGTQPAPSPKSMMASPSPQAGIVPSPASRGQPFSAPSPSSVLNTPGNPNSQSQVSPAPRSHEEQAYLDKLNKLSKYIEPLRRMINKLSTNRDEERKKDISKMEGLLKILTDPSKRLPMATLQKCEQVLDKLELSLKPSSVSKAPTPTVSTHMCQPLIDAVAAHMQSPMFNHCLQQTFGPAVTALYGSPIRAPSPPPKRKYEELEEEEEDEIPHILQGEIARLGNRFKVTLDPTQHSLSNAIHLLCRIDDKRLPSVPPISVTVPELYPEVSPECNTDADEYDCSPFLQSVQSTLATLLLRMPNRFTFTELMDKWVNNIMFDAIDDHLFYTVTLKEYSRDLIKALLVWIISDQISPFLGKKSFINPIIFS
ncbi:hypothetical protein FSP39_010276 [Pinctada imbricata]|uniref:Mediator complex subunit 15 n=1 Tax=Pinctada imbricata TaxID=66713 RepID=A0AA88XN39_PINIB|nr:hypothetical protein FSP39_010276 [Pinctada imbricata]